MQQFEIKYFFPLAEQIPLELDYEPSIAYAKKLQEERLKNSVTSGMVSIGNGGTWSVNTFKYLGEPSFTINVDNVPITIVSKKKPNFIMKFIYKSIGMKWKSE